MENIYVGRIVAVGINKDGKMGALYRISSRSFPNRKMIVKEDRISVVPKEGFEGDIFKNPYISYNCIRKVDKKIIVSNGSHTDSIAEKLQSGASSRDALTLSLLAMDYEKDDYNTPRIAGIVDTEAKEVYLAIVRKDYICVSSMPAVPGEMYYISTYEKNTVDVNNKEVFDVSDAKDCAEFIMGKGCFANMTNAVGSAVALQNGDQFEFEIV